MTEAGFSLHVNVYIDIWPPQSQCSSSRASSRFSGDWHPSTWPKTVEWKESNTIDLN